MTPARSRCCSGSTRYGVALVGAGGLLLFVCGLWLVGLDHDVGFGTGWVDAAIVLFLIAVALGSFGGRARRRRACSRPTWPSGDESVGPSLRALLDDPVSRAANYASAVLVLAVLALMVFKP